MALFSTAELETLAKEQAQWCISIYMQTHRKGVETQQDPVRLKELLKRAEARLVEEGVRAPDAQERLRPAAALLDMHDFWQFQSDGLALLLSPKMFRHYRLQHRFEDTVMVNTRFFLKPLLPLLAGDGMFYVLALSQGQVRLLRGTRDSVDEVYLDDIRGLPQNVEEAVKDFEFGRERNLHTFDSGEARQKWGRTAIFHGTGGAEEDSKLNIRRFFHQVNDGLHLILANEHAPMVLAGLDYLHPVYREVNTYPYLLDEGIKRSTDDIKPGELHSLAWKIVKPMFKAPEQQAIEAYKQLVGERNGRATNDLKQVIPAAFYGRVGTLLVDLASHQWGKFDPATESLQFHSERERGDDDLVDLAAVQTLLNNGNVFTCPPNEMPDHPVAAVLRY